MNIKSRINAAFTGKFPHIVLVFDSEMLKMNHLTLIVLVFTLQAVISAQLFEIQYDGIKLDDILKDEPLMEKYGDCILDVGPCTEDGKKIKRKTLFLSFFVRCDVSNKKFCNFFFPHE